MPTLMRALHLLTILTFAIVTSATPSETTGMARRAGASPGMVCYFECPASAGGVRFDGGNAYGNQEYACIYADYGAGVEGPICDYSVSSGKITYDQGGCPQAAIGPTCGSSIPGGSRYFAQSTSNQRRRVLSAAEEAIKRRQYSPAKVAREEPELVDGLDEYVVAE